LDSPFAIALFQAYMGQDVIAQSFVGIRRDDNRSECLLAPTHSNGQTQMNFCPMSPAARSQMERALPLVSALLPFTPRSVIVRRDGPLRAVEITSIDASNYSTSVHFLTESDIPQAYVSTPSLLDRLSETVPQLARANPKYRFAVTGESFICLTQNGPSFLFLTRIPTPNCQWFSHAIQATSYFSLTMINLSC
jgi:hypothetical protein